MLATLTPNNNGKFYLQITHRNELIAYAKNVHKNLKNQIINLTCLHYTVFEPNIKFKIGNKVEIIGNIEKNKFIGSTAAINKDHADIIDLTLIGDKQFDNLEIGLEGYTLG